MSSLPDHLPQIPGSEYAATLARSSGYEKFSSALEADYRSFFLSQRRAHVRFFNTVMFVLAVLAVGWYEFVHAGGDLYHVARLGTVAAAYLTMALVAHSGAYERAYLRSAGIASTVIAVAGAIEVACWIHDGFGELFAFLTVYSIGLYFLAGLLFFSALYANVALIFAFAVTLVVLGEPVAKTAFLTAILAGTGAIGGIAFSKQGNRFRRSFLEHGLIAEMAARDGLTGLKNRRAFNEHIVRTWQQALRDRRELVVMMIDVDFFKKFNDRYGHQAGDDALKRIAAVVDGYAKRPLDIAARYGGEELAVILFDVNRKMGSMIAEQIRHAVQGLHIDHADNRPLGYVTASIGVAVVRPRLDRSPEGVLQLADEALYAAKNDGRNRIVVYESEYENMSTGIFNVE